MVLKAMKQIIKAGMQDATHQGGGNGVTSFGRNRRRSPNQDQSILVYDLISEGPIEGLVGGAAGLYLDTTQVLNKAYHLTHSPRESFDASYTASSNQIVDNTGSGLFSGFDSSNGTYKVRIEGAKKAISGISLTAGSRTITSSGGFASNDISHSTLQYLRIEQGGVNGTTLVCRITSFISATSVRIDVTPEITASGLSGSIDLCAKISSKTNANTAVLSTTLEGGSADRDIANTAVYLDAPFSGVSQVVDATYNFSNVAYSFLDGTREQGWQSTPSDTGNASVIANLNKTLTTTNLSSSVSGMSNSYSTYGYGTAGDETSTWSGANIVFTSTQMNISTQKPAVDRLKITFQYDQMFSLKQKNGKEWPAEIEHRIFLRYKRPGDSAFTEELKYGPSDSALLARPSGERVHAWNYSSSGTVEAYCKNPFVEVFDIDLEPYQPLEDFEVKIQTVTPINRKHGGVVHYNGGRVQSIESVINDKLSYPLSSYATMMFNASDFGNVPERGYHCRGLLVQVPTNYAPAQERYEGAPATYTRNITTGAIESDYQAWDGRFRGDISEFNALSPNFHKVYSNNPAWVFYDIITNNRYGCGEYIDASDIDKYSLFKIARYCDELVPDGEGGVEPRFTANIYLTESAEAMKVLKDILSIFRGMMTWTNGQVHIEQNREKNPIAAFNKSNVLGGKFSYQSTRNRFRYNQVNVTWNDPKDFYKKTVEIVEDHDNIIETRQIKKKDVVAFGCTSRAQAVRYGKWHLFTDQLETDVVTFQTGIQGVNLSSGDVITVADADRNNVRFGGRTLASSTTTNIKVDSALDLSNSSTYFMEVVFPVGGAYLQQDTATIRGASRKAGDLILYADNPSGANTAITSEAIMVNAVDDNGNSLDLVWSGDTRVERQEVSSYNATSVTVASAFSSAPATHSIFAIIEVDSNGQDVHGSAKEYIIQNIKEDDQDPFFAITAVEFNRSKFSLVDRGYTVEDVPEVTRMPRYTENVPFPTDVSLKAVPFQQEAVDGDTDSNNSLLSLAVTWGHPSTERTDSEGNTITNKYEFIEFYEVRHNLGLRANKFETEIIPASETSFILPNPAQRIGTVLVRLTNTSGHFSKWIKRTVDTSQMVLKIPTSTTSKIGQISKGGTLPGGIEINSSTGTISTTSTTYDFTNTSGDLIQVTSGNTAQTSQAFAIADGAEAHLVYDFDDTSDPLKAIEVLTDTTARSPNVGDDGEIVYYNFDYVAEVGASNSGLTQKTGTVSAAQYSSKLTGSSTSFTTEFGIGDRVIIDSGTTRYFAVESDTELFLDQSLPRSYSGVNIFKTSFVPSVQDNILATVSRSGSTYSMVTHIVSDGDPGVSSAQVRIYQRNSDESNAPTLPSGDTTFTFNTGAISFTTANGWSATIPSSGGEYLWTSHATASGTEATDTIADSEWVTATLLAQDGTSGVAGINALLTNESATASTGSFTQGGNQISYTNTGGEMKVFQGASELTSGVVYGISGGTVGGSTTTKTQNGLTLTINNSTGVYSLSGASWSTELENFTLTGTVTASSLTIQKEYTIDKGLIFATTHLTASSQSFNYDGNSANPSPASVTLTAAVPNPFAVYGTYSYRFLKSTDGGANFTQVQARSSTRTHSVSAGALSLGNEIYKVEVYGDNFLTGGTYVVDEDEMTLLRLKDGQQGQDGDPGEDGAPGADGDDGESSITIFRESATNPGTPTAGTANPPTNWYSTKAAAEAAVSGTNIVWISVGRRPVGSTTITWNPPIRFIEDYDHIGGTKPPEDANKFIVEDDTTEGRWRFSVDDGSITNVDVFSSTERGKLDNLRQGKAPGNSNISIQNDSIVEADIVGSGKTFGAGQKPNKTTFADNSTQGVFTLTLDGTSSVVNVFDSTERGKLDNLRQGKAPDDANISIKNDGITLSADGNLSGGGTSAQINIDSVTGVTDFQSRVTTGLTDTGVLNTTVPVNKGGTGQTNTNKFLNSDLGITLDGDNITLTKAGDTDSTDTVPGTLKNGTIAIDSSTGQISGIGTGNNSRVFNDVIGISLDTTTNVGRLTISGVGASNTTADITKDNLGLDYTDGADVTANNTAADVTEVNGVAASTVSGGAARANAGLTSTGDVNRAVPVGKGGTGETNTNKFLNSGISIQQGNSGVFTLDKGDGTTDTTTITKAKLGLDYTDGADVTANNTANNVSNVGNQTVANAQDGIARARSGLASNGDVNRAVPTAKGGTGQTNTNTFLNSGISISQGSNGVFSLDRGNGTTDTTTITKNLLNLDYTDGADVTANNTANNVSNVGNQSVANAQDGIVRARAGLASNGDVDRAVPTTKGGTGQTNTNTFLNSSVTISQASNGTLTLGRGGFSSDTTTIGINTLANTPFDSSGNVNTGETIAVGSKFTIDRDNERILIED